MRHAGIILAWVLVCLTGAQAESNWQWEKTRTPRALVIKGIWWEYFQLDRALDLVSLRESEDFSHLERYSVVVLVNATPDRIPPGGLDQVREFVRNGGGLVVLGGFGAFGNSGYENFKPLVDLMPVDLKKNNGYVADTFIDFLPNAKDGAQLNRASEADWKMPYDFQAQPMAYYFHPFVAANGARVQVTVGGQPAIVTGAFGKGRVVACALSVNGDPPAGQTPFWEWKDWPKLLGQACEWAAGNRPAGTVAKAGPKSDLKALTEEEIRSAELELNELPKDFVMRAAAHPSERAAKLLFELAASTKTETKCPLDKVVLILIPYAMPEWAARLKPLAEESNPNIETRRAALTLLGACRDESSYGLLVKAVKDERTQLAAIEGLGRLGDKGSIPILQNRFDELMNAAQLPDGEDRFNPGLFATSAPSATYAVVALYRLGDANGVNRLCTFAHNLDLYRRIFANACKRAPRDTNGIAILAGLMANRDMLTKMQDYMASNVGPVPESQREAFVKYAMNVDDRMMIEFLTEALEKSAGKLSKAQWQALVHAKSGIIAKTSESLAAE